MSAGPTDESPIEATKFDLKAIVGSGSGGRASTVRRQYAPVTFQHRLGGSSPMFLEALATNETLQSVFFQFFRAGAEVREFYYTVNLTNARVVEVNQNLPENLAGDAIPVERIAIAFQSIEQKSFAPDTTFFDSL